jgi:formylglycine-generating enzyme required for sulfatase activity
LAGKNAERTPQWYITGRGQTMVVIPGPVQFIMGSPAGEAGRDVDETQHGKRIGRTFAIAAKPITVAEYRLFDTSYGPRERYTPTSRCPVVSINWYQAAAYCNWVNQQEGIPKDQWCYEMNHAGQVVRFKANYLSLTGYRLPTESEWEFACRAGAVTSRYYGVSEEILGKYAWFLRNAEDRSWPVGSRKPNDLGLFDMHGNVWCWCQESYKEYPKAKDSQVSEDQEDVLNIGATTNRVLRGGSFDYRESVIRSAHRRWDALTYRDVDVGFRLARTFH